MPQQHAYVRGTDLPPRGGITHGSQITTANTGPRVSTSASGIPAGFYTLNQAFLDTYNAGSALFSAKSFSGVEFNGATAGLAVTFRDCVFGNGAVRLIDNAVTNNGLIWFDYCHIYGVLNPYGSTDYSWSAYSFCNLHNLKLTRCRTEGFGSGIVCGDNVTIEETLLGDPAPYQSVANGGPQPDGTHHEPILLQGNSCSNVIIDRSRIKGVRGTPAGFDQAGVSAAFALYNDSYHPGPIAVTDCYFDGGGVNASYWGGIAAKPAAYADGLTVTGNIFGREYNRFCGTGSPAVQGDFSDPSNTWSNNRWGARGPYWVTGDPEADALISAPSAG